MTPIARQIEDMQTKDFAELKQLWRDYFQTEPPPYKRGFMLKALAYRIQELTYGGLPAETAKRLQNLVAEAEGKKVKRKTLPVKLPVAGTRLVREWQGERYEVIILQDGFEFCGRKWGSLSTIAKRITGTQWNGLAFFGLRKKERDNG